MKISKVKYSKLVSDNNYNNQSFGAEAIVEDGETPEDAFTNLRYWIDERMHGIFASREERDELANEVYALKSEKRNLEHDVENGREKFEWLKQVLAKHHIKLDQDIPF